MPSEKQPLSQSSPQRRSIAWRVAPNLWASFQYAWQGITYAARTQRNFRIHLGFALFAWVICGVFALTFLETALITAMVALVLVLELINTALESVVDLTVKQQYHDLAKIAKDCAAGAVLVGAIASAVVGILILIPHVLVLVG